MWPVLDTAGNSAPGERAALLPCLGKQVGRTRIKALLADREFIGRDGFAWLQATGIPFPIRLKRNT